MVRLRSLFICLLVLALPLQGVAAIAMVLCSNASHHTSVVAQVDSVPTSMTGAAGHDHARHDAARALSSGDADGSPAGVEKSTVLNHECGACASCCLSIALSGSPAAAAAQPLAAADMVEPFVAIHGVPPQALERPPRA